LLFGFDKEIKDSKRPTISALFVSFGFQNNRQSISKTVITEFIFAKDGSYWL
jgi:hypothetical protein